jgi:uncharacterized phage protein (TIGR02216 family)
VNVAPSSAFPWDDTMEFGLGVLRWPPAAFWASTPREIAAAARGALGLKRGLHDPPAPGDLAALLAAFPDEETT